MPLEFPHLSDQPITVQLSLISLPHLLIHALPGPSFFSACVKTLTSDGWTGGWGGISYQEVPVCLQVYTPVPGAAVCDSRYALKPESVLHRHASGSVKTHMDIKGL